MAVSQDELELAITKFQTALSGDDKIAIDRSYKRVCDIYKPQLYLQTWFKKYGWLYDSYDDFTTEYLDVFYKVLKEWKPREKRNKSRYNGKGHFKNYFWGSLSHHFSNAVKFNSAAKRNIPSVCPLCTQCVNVLSKHLIEDHPELLWDKLDEIGLDIDELTNCPFCKSFKVKKNTDLTANEQVRHHLLKSHTSWIFEKFNDSYPNHVTVSPKVTSIFVEADDEEDVCIYDITPSTGGKLEQLLQQNLTDLQLQIVEKILSGSTKNIQKYHQKLDCTEEEFNIAIDGLKDALVISGIYNI